MDEQWSKEGLKMEEEGSLRGKFNLGNEEGKTQKITGTRIKANRTARAKRQDDIDDVEGNFNFGNEGGAKDEYSKTK